MSDYTRLLRERALSRIDDLISLDTPHSPNWKMWREGMNLNMADATIEQLCVELACQMFAFSSRRASHLPILSAFNDREECEREERAVLARIREGCEG